MRLMIASIKESGNSQDNGITRIFNKKIYMISCSWFSIVSKLPFYGCTVNSVVLPGPCTFVGIKSGNGLLFIESRIICAKRRSQARHMELVALTPIYFKTIGKISNVAVEFESVSDTANYVINHTPAAGHATGKRCTFFPLFSF